MMRNQTKSKLALAARCVGISIPIFMSTDAMASINGPYTTDGNTAFLFHFDEPAGSTLSANAAAGNGNAGPLVGFTQAANTPAGTPNSTLLGGTGFTGFGNAATIPSTGSVLFGYDTNNNGSYEPDTGTVGADGITAANFTDGTGAFTIDAMVNLSSAVNERNREIVSFDSSGATRGFQFRINTSGQLEYNNIADAATFSSVASIPTVGPDAFALNTWFHVGMVYDGTAGPGSVKLYWTKVDPTRTVADQIGTTSLSAGDLGAGSNMLTVGNENRAAAGEQFNGLIDEVRISAGVRTKDQFIFGGANFNFWNNTAGGDWDSGPWSVGVPNAVSSTADFGGGAIAATADSTITLNGTKTVGVLAFDNPAFKFTLVAGGGGGTLALDNGTVAASVSVASGNHTIGLPVTMSSTGASFSVNGTLTVSGNITGPGSLTKQLGAGVLVLSGANTYQGATIVGDGILRATDGAGLPTNSNLTLNGGVFETSVNFARVLGSGTTNFQVIGGSSGFSAVALTFRLPQDRSAVRRR